MSPNYFAQAFQKCNSNLWSGTVVYQISAFTLGGSCCFMWPMKMAQYLRITRLLKLTLQSIVRSCKLQKWAMWTCYMVVFTFSNEISCPLQYFNASATSSKVKQDCPLKQKIQLFLKWFKTRSHFFCMVIVTSITKYFQKYSWRAV